MSERDNDGSAVSLHHRPALETSRVEDSAVLRRASVDDFANHAAPPSWRTGRRPLAQAWLAIASAIFWLVSGSTTALVVGTWPAVIGMVVTAAAFTAASHVLSRYATRTGITVVMFSRVLFGDLGAHLVALLLGVTGIYYGAFEASAVGIAFHRYFGGLPVQVWYLIMVAGAVLLGLGGIRVWLDRINRYLLPLYVAGLVAMVVWATVRFGYDARWLTTQPASAGTVSGPRWIFAVSVYLGQAVLLLFVWDYARLARFEDVTFNARVTFGAPFWFFTFVVNGLIGIFLVRTVPLGGAPSETSVLVGITALMGIFGILFIWVTQSRINTANYYMGSAGLRNLFGDLFGVRLPRPFFVVLAGVAIYAITLSDVFSFLLDALRYQGAFVATWLVVAVLHAVGNPAPDTVEFRPGRVPGVNVAGLAGWLTGAATGVLLLATVPNFGDTWALIVAMGVSALVFSACGGPWARFAGSAAGDPRDEVDDAWTVRVRCGHCARFYLALESDRDPTAGDVAICADCAARRPRYRRAARLRAR